VSGAQDAYSTRVYPLVNPSTDRGAACVSETVSVSVAVPPGWIATGTMSSEPASALVSGSDELPFGELRATVR
jgi:hypothetical protein